MSGMQAHSPDRALRANMAGRRSSVALLLAMVTVCAFVQPAAAVASIRVSTVVSTEVILEGAKGATVSIIQVCPKGSTLDRARTRSLIEPPDPGLRLLSREMWPRGMVTRWRVTVSSSMDGSSPRQAVVCVEQIARSSTAHTARATAAVRLWGPATARAWIWSSDSAATSWSGRSVLTTARLARTGTRGVRGLLTAGFAGDTVFAMAGVAKPYGAGRYTELRAGIAITSRPGRPAEFDNVHVPDFTLPRLGGGQVGWGGYRSGPVMVAVGTPAQVKSALPRLVATAAATPAHPRVLGLMTDLSSAEKFRPTPLATIQRQAGSLPAPAAYSAVPAPAEWFFDAAGNTGQVEDPFAAGLIAFVDSGAVIRFVAADAPDPELKKWATALK